jgi:hypothetical protein
MKDCEMEEYDNADPKVDHDLSPEIREQLDALFEGEAMYEFETKEELQREFMELPTDARDKYLAFRQEINAAFLLYRKRHTDGRELKPGEAIPVLAAINGLVLISHSNDADEIEQCLNDFYALKEHVRRQILSCLLEASNDSDSDKTSALPDVQKNGLRRCWLDVHIDTLDSLLSPRDREYFAKRREQVARLASR